MRRLTLSMSDELAAALDALAGSRNESRSALVEVLLREHPVVRQRVEQDRGPSLRQGRSLSKVLAVADQGKANRARAIREGRVRFDA